ncbi:PP2C family protein-serine/threonine phosphatase [Streptomyces thermolineatus]|uniref:PP2C family protein-serine/threonine phosphatase n=1 Tax=Streptomyces thermolineatus TaxID=44033 RepID=UPI00384A84B7
MAGEPVWPTGLLAAAEAVPPAESVGAVNSRIRERFDAASVSFLITDLSGNSLVRLGSSGDVGEAADDMNAPVVELAGTVHDRVIRTQQLYVEDGGESGRGGPVRVIAPVTSRGDSIGLLELLVQRRPGPADLREIGEAAHVLAYVVITDRRFTDLYQWGQRTTPLTLAAEIQHQLLPLALACRAGRFAVAGALEPAESIGGDTFDYALDRDALHLSLTDAMGHDVASALAATLLTGALRGARRVGAGLGEQAERADRALLDHGHRAMATGQLLRIDLRDGRARIVNAGHPRPLRLRRGRAQEVALHADLPFGTPFPHTYDVQLLDLEPGDRLVMLTDGMLEHSGTDLDLSLLIERTGHLHPREVVRALTGEVLRAHGGTLQDDAAVLCLDWYDNGRP